MNLNDRELYIGNAVLITIDYGLWEKKGRGKIAQSVEQFYRYENMNVYGDYVNVGTRCVVICSSD